MKNYLKSTDHTGFSNKCPNDIVSIFYSLAEDLENVPTDESACKFFASVWRDNTELAAKAFDDIVRVAGDKPRVAQALAQSVLEISDIEFRNICFDISIKRTTPATTRMLLNSCLVFLQYEKAVEKIDDVVRKACHAFLKNKLEASTLLDTIRQSCIFGRRELHEDISAMLTSLENNANVPYIHISDRKAIEVISNGMAYGEKYLKQVLSDEKSQIYEKEAAVFSLGCEMKFEYSTYFTECFERFYENAKNTGICNEIVGAVVYGASDCDAIKFLVNHLEKLRTDRNLTGGFLNLWHKHKTFITKRLLIGCTYCLCMSNHIANELKQWLDNKDQDIQVFTVLALEKQDISCPEKEKELKSALKSERSFREDCVFYTDLIRLRQCNLQNACTS